MYGLVQSKKERAKEEILGHFKQEIEEISHKELALFSHTQIQKITYRSGGKQSTLKVFSAYQAAVVFLHQSLFETSDSSFFDSLISNHDYKEDVEVAIETACQFAAAYLDIEGDAKIAMLNSMMINEIKKTNISVHDDTMIATQYKKLFTKDDRYTAKMHILQVKDIRSAFKDISCMKMKCFSKENVFSLLILYRIYHDETHIKTYESIKIQSNISARSKIQEEIKSIASDYIQSKDKGYIEQLNRFFLSLCDYIMTQYFISIDEDSIQKAFSMLEQDIKVQKWHARLWMKKDTWLLSKMTLKTQHSLDNISNSYAHAVSDKKIYKGDFLLFSSMATLADQYDHYFGTISVLSEVLNHDFSPYQPVAGMNIKNFYEASTELVEIEAINRFLSFWMQLNKKILEKKTGKNL